jgi:DNA primase
MSGTAVGSQQPDDQDIYQVVSGHTVLHPHACDRLRGLRPFCRSSGFRLRPEHGTFHCFGCGEGGDAVAFTDKIGRS